ncbi:iron-containing redox enzyme family protein [Ramlibacter sp.]|uniref:TenA family transcriptional regulator n=1 Tax=Ramlibacter sp. TaxID=1917967 RepID=UPI001811B9EA|nr:iron-containing redox enzyme family protein [Ramlibacter sp.]MBA2676029.1 iron-containing redox enzyme family protein [Ramlibacter sp.]
MAAPSRSAANAPRSAARAEIEDKCRELQARLTAHPFLRRCADGSVTEAELHSFLIQQSKYSSYFTRYLCALISRLEDGDAVLKLAQNLCEELGFGDSQELPHSQMYARMLSDFGLQPQRHATAPETQALIDTMFDLCGRPAGAAGLGALCLGAEAVVPDFYSHVIAGFRSRNYPDAALRFFAIHVDCDDGHATTMFEVIEQVMERSPDARAEVFGAADVAITARLRMLDAIERAAP